MQGGWLESTEIVVKERYLVLFQLAFRRAIARLMLIEPCKIYVFNLMLGKIVLNPIDGAFRVCNIY